MKTYSVYGTHTAELLPKDERCMKMTLIPFVVVFCSKVDATCKSRSLFFLLFIGHGVAGLNIAPEVPAMMMFRYVIFGVACLFSKPLCEVRK